MKTDTWTSRPCNLQNLPREKTPEGQRLLRMVREWLVADMAASGFDPFALSTYPAPPKAANLAIRQAVRRAMEVK